MNFTKAYKTFRTYLFWALISLIFGPICLVLASLPTKFRYDNRLYFICTSIWNRLMLFFTFVHIKVRGEENLPIFPNSPSIIISNHISALDVMLIDSLLGNYPRVWLGKSEFSKIPFFGYLLRQMHVLVDRANPRKSMEALIKSINLIKDKKRHLVLFPEGTRSKDGSLGEFLEGFSYIAKKTHRPLIPIFIKNSDKILPSSTYLIDPRASIIEITIGKHIYIEEDEGNNEFFARVKEWYLAQSK